MSYFQNMTTGKITSNPSGNVESLRINFNDFELWIDGFNKEEVEVLLNVDIHHSEAAKLIKRSQETIYNKRKDLGFNYSLATRKWSES